MKRFILLIAAAWLGLWSAGTVSADIFGTPRMRRVAPKRIPAPMPPDAWDSERVYPQLVVLIEYSDTTFSMLGPKAYYNRILNERGFNKGAGPGCAAEYMLEQSKGLFHVQFDVIGPIRIDLESKYTPASQTNYGLWGDEDALKDRMPNLHIVEPMGYLEFNYLVERAKAVMTDSGGITEETTVMGVPCITLRDNTERPETCTVGTNELIGTNPDAVAPALKKLFAGQWKKGAIPELWDGKAAERIIRILADL